MTTYQEAVLERLDDIDQAILESDADVAISLADAYFKQAMILEAALDPMEFAIFQEGGELMNDIGDSTSDSAYRRKAEKAKQKADAAADKAMDAGDKSVLKLMKDAKEYFDTGFKNFNAQLKAGEGVVSVDEVEKIAKSVNNVLGSLAKKVKNISKIITGAQEKDTYSDRSKATSPMKIRAKTILSKIADVFLAIINAIGGFFKWIVTSVISFFKKIGKRKNGDVVLTYEQAAENNLIPGDVNASMFKGDEYKGDRAAAYNKSAAATERFKKYGIVAIKLPDEDGYAVKFRFITQSQADDLTGQMGYIDRYEKCLDKIVGVLSRDKAHDSTADALLDMLRNNTATIKETQQLLNTTYKQYNATLKKINNGQLKDDAGNPLNKTKLPGDTREIVKNGKGEDVDKASADAYNAARIQRRISNA